MLHTWVKTHPHSREDFSSATATWLHLSSLLTRRCITERLTPPLTHAQSSSTRCVLIVLKFTAGPAIAGEMQKRRCWPAALLQIASMLISLTWATRVTYHTSPQPLHTLLALPGSLSLLSDFEGHVSVSRSSIRDLTPQVSLQSRCSYLCQQLRTSMNKESSGSV